MTLEELSKVPTGSMVKLLMNERCEICDLPAKVDNTGTHLCHEAHGEYELGQVMRGGNPVHIVWEDDGIESIIDTKMETWGTFVRDIERMEA